MNLCPRHLRPNPKRQSRLSKEELRLEKIRLLRGREIVALRKEKDRRRRKLAPVPGPVVFKGRARKPWTGRQFRVRLARLLAED